MKKLLVAILALVYLTTSVGATIRLHYCMDKLVNWGFGKEKSGNDSCSYCGMSKSATDKHRSAKGCCKDDQKQIKLDNDQKLSEVSFKLEKIPTEAISPVFAKYSFKYVTFFTSTYQLTHSPPQIAHCPLFILNCDYRI